MLLGKINDFFVRMGMLVIAVGILSMCAEERDAINRVQPYAIKKAHYIGEDYVSVNDDPEFYYQTTLIDVGYGATENGLFTSTYSQELSRIKWEITEEHLIGHLSYERVDGTDGRGKANGWETQDGIIAIMFKIKKHFDIVNQYNPTTGEKLNVMEENSVDRPWYERDYMRVDWSRNIMVDNYDFDTLSLLGIYGGIEYESIAYAVEDPHDKDAPYFDFDNGYFDITTKAFAKPGILDISSMGWWVGAFPACFFDADFFGGSWPEGQCNPIELTLRHSFRRVVDNDFEPYDRSKGWRTGAFGGFSFTDRYGYTDEYGLTDELHREFLSKFQIWERAHFYKGEWASCDGDCEEGDWVKQTDENGEPTDDFIVCAIPGDTTPVGADVHRDEDGDGTEDECKQVATLTGMEGSRCDEFTHKCTLPYRLRKNKALVWYVTEESDNKYFYSSELAVHDWDATLRTAVRAAKYSECMNTMNDGKFNEDDYIEAGGRTPAQNNCVAQYPMYFGQQTDNDDVISLAMEMDDCRSGKTYTNLDGAPWSDTRVNNCKSEIDKVGAARVIRNAVIDIAKMDESIVFCHSPVEAGDHPKCAPEDKRLPGPGDNEDFPDGVLSQDCDSAYADGDEELIEICENAISARRGDLRYHQVNLIKEDQSNTPWGIMTSSNDPTNGQTIIGVSNVWTFVNELWAQMVVDYMRYAAGELKTEDVTSGKYVKDWSQAVKAATSAGSGTTMTKDQVQSRIAGMIGMDVETFKKMQDSNGPRNVAADIQMRKDKDRMSSIVADGKLSNYLSPFYQARMNAVKGGEWEATLMNKPIRQAAGVDGMPMVSSMMDYTSPLRGGNPQMRREMERMKQLAMGERGMCEIELTSPPLAYTGLTKIMQEKFGNFNPEDSAEAQHERAVKMKDYIAQRAHETVIVHEMGHVMSHRHNFVSSSDAYNYRPQYWQLRTDNGTILKDDGTLLTCGSYVSDGKDCVGPRWYDPVSTNEEENMIWMWMHSSVMDYAGEKTQDFMGVAAWDVAALRMFYGDTVAVYPKKYAAVDTSEAGADGDDNAPRRFPAIMQKLDNFGGIVGFQYNLGLGMGIHYSELNHAYELIKECHTVDINAFKPARYDSEKSGEWHPVLDGMIVSIDGGKTYSRCHQPDVDYVPWSTLSPPDDAHHPKYGSGPTAQKAWLRSTSDDNSIGSVLDKHNRIRVPYGYATDRWADLGNASVYRHDNGADSYEIFNFMITEQELYHIFGYYRRNRADFSLRRSYERILNRYNTKMRDGAKGLTLLKGIYRDIGIAGGQDGDDYWRNTAVQNWYTGQMLASANVFDHFTRMVQRPSVGPHRRAVINGIQLDEVLRVDDDDNNFNPPNEGNIVVVPNGAFGTDGGFTTFSPGGKLIQNRLDDKMGENSANYTDNCGSYYDKIYTAMLMTESVDNYISDSRMDFVDKRYRATSIADLFPDGFRRFLGNALTGDGFMNGPRVAADASGNPIVDAATKYPTVGLGWTQWWGDTVKSCFPKDGTTVCSDLTGTINAGDTVEGTRVLDPQLGWEVQKFLLNWTYIYNVNLEENSIMENDMQQWKDLMWMWDLADVTNADDMDNRIEFHHPLSRSYVARTYGKEDIFGRTVQKGIAARVLEYANELLVLAYETADGPDLDGDGNPDWYEPVITDGAPTVLHDPKIVKFGSDCNSWDNSGCTCSSNYACIELSDYLTVLDWMADWAGFADHSIWGWNDMTGVYNLP